MSSGRKATTGIFRVLDSLEHQEIDLDVSSVASECKRDKRGAISQMWTGLLTDSPSRDQAYMLYLSSLEKTLVAMVDVTIRRWAEDPRSPQLAVFVRRLWNTVFPVSGKAVEDEVVSYDTANRNYFRSSACNQYQTSDVTADSITAAIRSLEEEIEQWERIRARGDARLDEFRRQRSRFAEELAMIESSHEYFAGGTIPRLPAWEEPRLREQHKFCNILHQEYESIVSEGVQPSDRAVGVPSTAFCFVNATREDDRELYKYKPFYASVDGELIPENPQLPSNEVVTPSNEPVQNRRVSIDAVMAFQ
jgi:hypothetical protein